MATTTQYWSPAEDKLFQVTSWLTSWHEMNAIQIARTSEAFGLWDDVSGFTAIRGADNLDLAERASTYNNGFWGAYLPNDWSRVGIGDITDPALLGVNQKLGDGYRYHQIIIDSSLEGISNFQLGSTAFQVLLHEIGHSIVGVHITDTVYDELTRLSTVMNNGSVQSNAIWHPSTPMTLDIDKARELYGATETTRLGNDTYGFNASFSGAYRNAFDFDINTRPLVTIYDDGGIDTFDVSGFRNSSGGARSVRVNLEQGIQNVSRMLDGAHQAFGVIYDRTWIENAVTGEGDDQLYGNSINNVLRAGGGDDYLYGFWGADTLFGDAGDDILEGGVSPDHIYGGDGLDIAAMPQLSISDATVTEFNGVATVNTAFGPDTIESDVEIISFSDGQFARLFGTDKGEILSPHNSSNGALATVFGDSLYGFGGNDVLDGGKGGDRMFGGSGNDTYIVNSVDDLVREDGWSGGDAGGLDEIRSTVSYVLGQFLENMTLAGAQNVSATGNDLANTLRGNRGSNAMSGAGKADTLVGGLGADSMDGGGGADTFVYAKISESTVQLAGRDTIIGFRHAQHDVVNLMGIDADATRKGNQAFDWNAGSSFSRAAGQLHVSYSSDGVTVSGEVTGDGRADFALYLEGVHRIVAADFLL